ncbi:MAG: glycosyltransferase family 4 protein [Candidatus Bathyarchaeota archaeon]|nr:glycosyltransferase family 4 protein [Candidatus Bathyarchaeota archaeon]MDH5746046.1 glycosyltransferase family 4 protein [Candidatus Bathyarchaeota archaeon]
MKIAFCLHISLAYGGGGEKWTIALAKALKDKGHNIEIYALPYVPNKRKVLQLQKTSLDSIPYHEAWRHRIGADVAYIFYNPLSYVFFKTKCPKIAGIHSQIYFLPKTPPITYGIPAILARLFHKIIGEADLSLFDAVHMVNKIQIKHRKIHYIPNFVDSNVYKPRNEKNCRFTVLFAGRPSWQKGWDIFLKVAYIVKKMHPDIDFMWAGGHDEEIKGVVNCLGYIGKDKQLSEVYSAAHLVLLPSRSDIFGVTILESLACGTPVITTPITTHKALNLPLFYGEHTWDFVRAIEQLRFLWQNDKEKYMEISSESQEAVKVYEKSKIVKKIEAMLMEIANNN